MVLKMSKSAVKFIALIQKKDGISAEAFQKHYETIHVPLVDSLCKKYSRYIRNYTGGGVELHPGSEQKVLYDAVTEFWFDTEEDYRDFMAGLKAESEGTNRIGLDELNFIKTGTVQSFRVHERGGDS